MTVQIDPDVSDLFFNHDLSDAKDQETGEWLMDRLSEEAEMFLGSIQRLTNLDYSANDLIADFFNRM